MASPKSDISINVTAHSERILLHKTLRSLLAGYNYAKSNGVKNIEFNIGLDNADEQTTAIAEKFKKANPEINLYKISVKDLGENRNFLVSKSSGKYIAFFDGDDFFTENYLYEAFKLAEKNKEPAVYSPAFMVNFEAANYIIPKLETTSPGFKTINLFETNYFISQSFVSREIHEKIKYLPNCGGYGMEDWHWNTRAINEGFNFYNVPNTIFFYRRKLKGSMIVQQTADKAMLRPTALFQPENFLKYDTYEVQGGQNVQAVGDRPAKKLKKAAVKGLRQVMSGDSLIYRYLRDQYIINRKFAGESKSAIRNKSVWMKPKHNSDLYHDPLSINKSIPPAMAAIGVNDILIDEWSKLNNYEPMIRPSMGMLEIMEVAAFPETSRMSTIYYKLCEKYGKHGFTDVVFVPHLVRGGADLAAINLVKALAEELGRKVLVFITDGTESPWGDKIREINGADLIEFRDEISKYLNPDQIELMIAYLIQNWGVERVSIINSGFGYNIAEHYGRQLRGNTKIFLYTFAFDMTPDGYLFNYLTNGLVNLYNDIDLYFTDSKGYCAQLREVNGFDEHKVHEIYMPIAEKVRPKQNTQITKKVLWASRISKDKIPEVAVEVARLIAKEGIELHIYGSMDTLYELGSKFKKMISGHQNLVYHGSYDGFHSLPVDDYDIFLLTSKNEGLPNVILEAIMSDLFIVTPKVGGLPEVVVDGKNGFLVENNFDPADYADKIIRFYKDEKLQDLPKRRKLNEDILSRHNWSSFVKRLRQFY